jgi:hypothetical protein
MVPVIRRRQVQTELPLLHLLMPSNDECHYGEPSATFSVVGRVSVGAAAA